MKTSLLSLVGVLLYATTSVRGHGVLVEPPVRAGMGKLPANDNLGKKLIGVKEFWNNPENSNTLPGCGSAASTGNPGKQDPTVTWTSGTKAKVCWEITLPHLEQQGIYSPGVRVSIAYGPTDRFDKNILLKDLDAGPKGIYCSDVTVPAQTCENCILQWSWVSLPDGGAYVGCADIRIIAQSNVEKCSADVWPLAVGNCAQGNGKFDLSPMGGNGVHPGQKLPIDVACGAGATKANWQNKGAHGGYTDALTTKKGDIKYGNTIVRRLGPGTGCPAGAKTPPILVTQPPQNNPGTTKPPNNNPGQTTKQTTKATTKATTTTTRKPCTTPPCDCPAGVVAKLGGPAIFTVDLMYPITVANNMKGGEKVMVSCASANKGYVKDKGTHSGFQISCARSNGNLYITGGGSCAGLPKCSSIANDASRVCGTGQYNPNAANEPCTSKPCKRADSGTCCTGGNNNNNNGGGSGNCAPCYGLTLFSSTGASCGMANRQTATSVTPNGQCNKLPGSDSYYQLSCNGDSVSGKFGCDSATCNQCAQTNFELLKESQANTCISNAIECDAGQQGTCQAKDFFINKQCVASDASTWAVSAFAAAVVMANV